MNATVMWLKKCSSSCSSATFSLLFYIYHYFCILLCIKTYSSTVYFVRDLSFTGTCGSFHTSVYCTRLPSSSSYLRPVMKERPVSGKIWIFTLCSVQLNWLTDSSCFQEFSMCCCALRPSWKCLRKKRQEIDLKFRTLYCSKVWDFS